MNFALDFIVKPGIILSFAALLSIPLRRSSASVRHALWFLALSSAALLPLLSMTIQRIEVPAPGSAEAIVTFLTMEDSAQATGLAGRELRPRPYALATLERILNLGIQPAHLWILGAGFLLLRLVMGAVAVRRVANAPAFVADDTWNALAAELCSLLLVRRPVHLLFSEKPASPMTWGVVRHKILFPTSAAKWSMERRRLVLAHELAPVKRNDGLIQIFVQTVCCIYWFNPLVWYAVYRIRVERERACDDHVLNLGASATDYAEHLLQIVRGLRTREAFAFATVSMAQPSQLETRLVSILNSRTRRRGLSKLGVVSLCALTCVLTVLLAAVGVAAAVPLPPVLAAAFKFVPPLPAPAPVPESKSAAAPQRTRIGNAGSIPSNAVIPPRVLESRPPLYTQEAVRNNIQGIVTFEAAVDLQGKVTILRLVNGLGFGLDEKARQAVLSWKFGPATRNGVPVEAVTQIDVEFTIPVWYNPPQNDTPPIRMGPGVTPPAVIFRVEPEYTEEARKERYNGTAVVRATIHQDGTLTVGEVIRELDYGLTEKAIEALEYWKFKPAMKDGKAVGVTVNIEVNFNLK